MNDNERRNGADLARVLGGTSLDEVIDDLGVRDTAGSASKLIQAARDGGDLAVVLAGSNDGRELELLCGANDHDASTAAALAQLPPRDLLKRLNDGQGFTAMSWGLAPLNVVIAALLTSSLGRFVRGDADESEGPGSDEEVEEGSEGEGNAAPVGLDDHDELDPEFEEELMRSAARSFRASFAESFEQLFVDLENDGKPARYDLAAARDIELDGRFGNVGQLLDADRDDERFTGLNTAIVTEWIAALVGEKEILLQPVTAEGGEEDFAV